MKESKVAPSRRGRWGQDRRLEFIDSRLYWEGRLNRADLTDFFSISVPQASLDFAEYQARAPGNMAYDRGEKAYLAADGFAPILTDGSSTRYLAELYALTTGAIPADLSFLGALPASDVVRHPTRLVSAPLLRQVLRAINTQNALEITYQTIARPEPDRRVISPHALAYDGYRWHIRAYCHNRRSFRDFLFARILECEGPKAWLQVKVRDEEWETPVTIAIGPNPALEEGRRRVIALDYGMTDGRLDISTRLSLAFYLLKRLGLDRPIGALAPHEQHITLLNRAELEPVLSQLNPRNSTG